MKKLHVFVVLAIAALVGAGLAIAGLNNNSSIHLNGQIEVPIRDTDAQGQAIFHIDKDGSSIDYKLIAANIDNVFQAHIHCGAPGATGPVVVWLFPSTTPAAGPTGQGRVDGVIAEGTITGANVQPHTGCPEVRTGNLGDVIALLQNGGGYVNIHTSDGVNPANTGPGDFPGGEIRGDTP
jgi:CHRD domain-containing protein